MGNVTEEVKQTAEQLVEDIKAGICRILGSSQGKAVADMVEQLAIQSVAKAIESQSPALIIPLEAVIAAKASAAAEAATNAALDKLATKAG